jgi:4-amino-4-deoxy-L-arabinose transferase-like glycosyltransferase
MLISLSHIRDINKVPFGGDENDYYQLALNLNEKKAFVQHEFSQKQFQGGNVGDPTSFRNITYPLYISLHLLFSNNLNWIFFTQILLFSISVVFLYNTCLFLFDKKISIVVAVLWMLYPTMHLSWYGFNGLMSENIALFFIILSMCFYIKFLYKEQKTQYLVLAAILMGLTVLSRGFVLFIFPLLALWLLKSKVSFRSISVYVIVCSMTIGTWVIRNKLVMGDWILSTQTDSFFWGNNGWSRGSIYGDVFELPAWTAPQVQPLLKKYPDIKNFTELELSKTFSKEGKAYLMSHPAIIPELLARKTAIYVLPFQMWEYGWYRYHYLYFFLLIGALWSSKNYKKEFFLLMIPYIAILFSALLTISMCRYRIIAEPFIIVLGVIGWADLYRTIKNKFSNQI